MSRRRPSWSHAGGPGSPGHAQPGPSRGRWRDLLPRLALLGTCLGSPFAPETPPPLGETGVLQPLRTDTLGGEESPASAHPSPDSRCSPAPSPAHPDASVPTLWAARHIAKPLTHFFSVATPCVRPLKRPRITVGVSSKWSLCPPG